MLLQSYRLSSLIAHSVILKNRWQIKCELMDIRQLKENEGLHYIGLSFGGVNGWTVSFEYKNYRFYRIEFVKDDTSKYPILTDISRKIAAKHPQYVIEDFVDYYPNDFFRFDGGCKISDGQVTCYMYANRIRLPNNTWEYMSNLVYDKSGNGRFSSTDEL